MTDGERLALIASKHARSVTTYVATVAGPQLILASDPKRFFVRFIVYSTVGNPRVYPATTDGSVANGGTFVNDIEFKYFDCPAIVTGEFYMFATGVGQSVMIIQDLYVGR